jgi:quinol monooxygenase YgiN
MSNVVVVASFKVQDGRVEEAIAALAPVIEQTHDEPGCLSYALHRDVNDPLRLVLVERWTSQVALESHFQQPYLEGLGQLAQDLLSEPPTLSFCTPVPLGDDMKGTL